MTQLYDVYLVHVWFKVNPFGLFILLLIISDNNITIENNAFSFLEISKV